MLYMESRRVYNHAMKYKVLPCGCHKVSSGGSVFSLIRQYSEKGHQGIITTVSKEWKVLGGVKTAKGYWQVAIHGRSIRVNRLVAQNFIVNPYAYPESQHINGNKDDNSVKNLKWGNQKHNAEDRERHGNTMKGSRNANAKLCSRDIVRILALRKDGNSFQSIARKYNVSKKLILLICQRKIWRCVNA